MELGEMIARYRKDAGMTIDELSEASGVPKGTLNKIIAGTTKAPTLDTMKAIAKALGKRLADFDDGIQVVKTNNGLSAGALKLAKDYETLDSHGMAVVRVVMDEELNRMEELSNLAEMEPENEPKIINIFVNPSAAGPALGDTWQDCEPYELQKDDPQGAEYAVRVQGQSMEPYFQDGSIAFVNHDQMRDGDIGIFCVDGATVIKQWHYDRMLGITYLFSLNRDCAANDVIITRNSGRQCVWQGRVITRQRFDLPGM